MADEGIFLDEEHPHSGRFAVFEVNHYSGWLYLSEPGQHNKQAKRALVFSTGHLAPLEEAIKVANAGGRPPLSHEYASELAVIEDPHPDEFFFWWSEDGESVALMRLGKPLAMITARSDRGHTKAVAVKGFYGEPWHQERYDHYFGREMF